MKQITFFAVVIASLACVSFSTNKDRKEEGIWKGAYGTADTTMGIIVLLKKGNHAVVYAEKNNRIRKIKGTYTLNIDDVMSISFRLPESNTRIVMTGDINASGNFIAGDWQTDNNENGDFYFHKQVSENDEKIVSVKLVTEVK